MDETNIDATFVDLSTTVWRTLLITVCIPIPKIHSNTEHLIWMNDQGNLDIKQKYHAGVIPSSIESDGKTIIVS